MMKPWLLSVSKRQDLREDSGVDDHLEWNTSASKSEFLQVVDPWDQVSANGTAKVFLRGVCIYIKWAILTY
jgi:hypothetical protein